MIESFKLPNITPETVSGSICSFNDEYGNLPLKSCTSLISGYQEGSGTPSPTNIRPLHAFSSGTLTANSNIYTFTFGQNIYQGEIDWERGVVVGNKLLYDIGSQNWYKSTSGANSFFYRNFTSSPNSNFVSEIYQFYGVISSTEFGNNAPNYNLGVNSTGSQMYIRNDTYTDPSDFKTAMNGVMLAYELATPIEIPLGGINLLTQQGVNNIFCDTGDTEVNRLKVN